MGKSANQCFFFFLLFCLSKFPYRFAECLPNTPNFLPAIMATLS